MLVLQRILLVPDPDSPWNPQEETVLAVNEPTLTEEDERTKEESSPLHAARTRILAPFGSLRKPRSAHRR
jgi:hypothetical protein